MGFLLYLNFNPLNAKNKLQKFFKEKVFNFFEIFLLDNLKHTLDHPPANFQKDPTTRTIYFEFSWGKQVLESLILVLGLRYSKYTILYFSDQKINF